MSRMLIAALTVGVVSFGSVDIAAAQSDLNANGHLTGLSNSMPGVGVDAATGTVTTSVKIEVPPGRNGIAPDLALRYNSSNNKNGVAGYGWTVPLGSIERLANKGVPKYDSTDQFFLAKDRMNKLVHLQGDDYRAEIEELFLKIQYVGGAHWVVTDPNGTRSFYGQTAASRVADPLVPSHVFRFLLDRVEDVNGNYMTVSYTQFTDEDKYPLEVQYTGNVSGSGGANPNPYARVLFVYEAANRPDPSFSYLPGFKIAQTKRLDQIDVKLMSGPLQRRYDLIYTLDSAVHKSYLTKVRRLGSDGTTAMPDINLEYSGIDADFQAAITVPSGNAPSAAFQSGNVRMLDLDGDGCSDLVYGPPGGAPWLWYRSDCNGSFLAPVAVQNSPTVPIPFAFNQGAGPKFQDFTGDGLIDVVHQVPGQYATLWINNGQGGFNAPMQANLIVDRDAKYMDMNADGLVDLVYGYPPYVPWFISLNLGNGNFDTNTIPVANAPDGPVGGQSGSYYFEYGDYNGDGLIDVARASQFWMNNGQDGFNPMVTDPDLPSSFVQSSYFGWLHKADINGDGLTDYLETIDHCYPSPPCFPVYSCQGNDSFGSPYYVNNLYSHGYLFFDLNGDGYQDILTSTHDSFNNIWQFNINDNGTNFLPPVPITQHHSWLHFDGNASPPQTDLVLADVNGDNRLDVVYGGDPDFNGPLPLTYQVWLGKKDARSARGGVLVAISNSVGLRTEFTYKAQPVRGRSGAQYGYSHQSFKLEAVASKKDIITINSAQYTTNYTYEGGLWDEADREFRGYAEVTETDQEGNYTVTQFHQDDVLKFRPFEAARYKLGGQLMSKTANTWTSSTLNPGVKFVYRSDTNDYTYDGNGTGRRTRQQFDYGENPQYGNLTQHTEWGEVDLATGADIGTDKRTTYIEYGNNVSGATYLIGFQRHISKRDMSDNNMRETWRYYDGATTYTTLPIKGLLTKEERWNDAGLNAFSEFAYDAYGNQVSVRDANQHLTTTGYDTDWALLPVTVTNAFSQVHQSAYYGIQGVPLNGGGYQGLFGQRISTTDPNGQVTYTIYDPLGRPVKLVAPLDTVSLPTVEVIYTAVNTPGAEHWRYTIKKRVEHGQAGTLDEYDFFDGKGRVIQTKKPMETSGTYAVTEQSVYDSYDRPTETYAPFSSSLSVNTIETIIFSRPHTTSFYDALGRTTQTTNADGGYRTTVYDDWTVTTIDENGHKKKETQDAYGLTARIEEYRGADGRAAPTYPASAFTLYATTNFTHNSENELEAITDNAGHVTSMLYDKLGRKTYTTQPDSGATDFEYDLNGNMLWQVDAKGQKLEMTYDVLNRLDTKAFPQSTVPTVDYIYDAPSVPFSKGRITNVDVTSSQGADLGYDELGHQTFLRETIDSTNYDVQMTYDAIGRVKVVTYPDLHQIQYTYNNSGAAETVTDLAGVVHVSNTDYDARGKITDIYFGNGVHTAYTYHPQNFRLTRTLTQKSSTVLQDLNYTYDPGGNVLSILNGITGQTETFVYDELNRLTQATGPYCSGSMCTKAFAYDEIGNIAQKEGLTYTYGQNGAGPHAVTSLSDGSTMAYDSNGNMTRQTRPGVDYIYTYDRENRLTTVKKNASLVATYDYDDRGHRVKTTVSQARVVGGPNPIPQPLNAVTHFVENLFEKRVDSGVSARHIYLGAMRVVSVSSDGKTRYVHTDHLSGTNVTTDETGVERERLTYAPYGQVATHTTSGGTAEEAYFQFTGQRFDEESTLLFMQARYYDSKLGRFLTPDSVIPDMSKPQALNRYSYAYNNPVRLVDPTGHSPEDTQDDKPKPQEQGAKKEEVTEPSSPPSSGVDVGADTAVVKGSETPDSNAQAQSNAQPNAQAQAPSNSQAAQVASATQQPSAWSQFWSVVGDIAGFIWSLPNTIIGVTLGIVGIPWGGIGFGDGQIQFKGNLLMSLLAAIGGMSGGAITFGEAGIFTLGFPPSGFTGGQRNGEHEGFHTEQGHILGPLYIPANIIGGIAGELSGGDWHAPANFMEAGPLHGRVW